MLLSDIKQLEIRMCWPNPDNVCLEGGCIHCAEGANSKWVTLEEVRALVLKQLDTVRGRHGHRASLKKAFFYGLHTGWHNLPKRKLNVRRARAWHGTPDDQHYTGWEHMQRET